MFTKEQIELGLKNKFIQVEITTIKGLNFINKLNLGLELKKDWGIMYVFGQDFKNGFGLNASYTEKENLTLITDTEIIL